MPERSRSRGRYTAAIHAHVVASRARGEQWSDIVASVERDFGERFAISSLTYQFGRRPAAAALRDGLQAIPRSHVRVAVVEIHEAPKPGEYVEHQWSSGLRDAAEDLNALETRIHETPEVWIADDVANERSPGLCVPAALWDLATVLEENPSRVDELAALAPNVFDPIRRIAAALGWTPPPKARPKRGAR